MPTGIYKRKSPTKETIEKRASKLRGKKRPPFSKEWKQKISKGLTGLKQSEESKKRKSDSLKGRIVSVETREKIGLANSVSLKGKKHSLETKLKMSESHKGAKSSSWRGGISTENEKARHSLESKLWKDSVKNRDSNCCQKCEEHRVKYLTAHHILNFSKYIELRFAIDNDITLCRPCHKVFHMKYGFRDNNKDQLNEFLTN